MAVKLRGLTSFDDFWPFEQIAWFQQLREPAPRRGRPRKLRPELLTDRRQVYLDLFSQLLSNPEIAKILFHGPPEVISKTLWQRGYGALLNEDQAAAWIQEAMQQAMATLVRRSARVRFLTDYLIAKQARTSLRYLRRVFNQAKRRRPRALIL